jgi:16S rRNA pseudouridine516 synthase
MRLDKFICKSTDLLKPQAITCIRDGQVLVNGEKVFNEATQVHENNRVMLDDNELTPRPFRYLMLHKTQRTICSNVDDVYPSIFNGIDIDNVNELHVAGRLDADTTGLVLVTDDGRWSFDIIRPNQECKKVYRVMLSRPLALGAIEKFANGIALQGEDNLTRPAILDIVDTMDVRLTIVEGKFHQVKRMFAAVGNRVVSLHREKIGDVKLDVALGQWRYLTPDEIKSFIN